MKNLLLSTLFLVGLATVAHSQQQGLRIGAHAAIPLSDASDFSSVNLGADASYLFDITDKFALGAATGYSAFLGKDDFDTYSFVPIAVSGRASYGKNIFYAADIGYALALNTDADSGLYYQAKLGWTNNTIDAFIFYKGISTSDVSLAAIGVGVAYKLY